MSTSFGEYNPDRTSMTLIFGGGLILICLAALWLGQQAVELAWPASRMSFATFIATTVNLRTITVWHTSRLLPSPKVWHGIAAGVPLATVVAVLYLGNRIWHATDRRRRHKATEVAGPPPPGTW